MGRDDSLTRIDAPSDDHSASERRPEDPYESIGTSLGRYVVVERIGSGGMGTVVRAYDPRLHREVALKRVHRGAIGRDAADRMMREAQAMAQLSHPNVVAVYDVETIDDTVVIAMEYVAGSTLDVWCRARARTWREILDAYLQAGRGLHAAHKAAIVHRDFKPANVLVSETGLVKVMDFGLAKQLADAEPSESAMLAFMAGTADSVGLDRTLTRGDMVVGTPRFMAPEQHVGEIAGPEADQYAFCVSLWEAITERRLFALDSVDAIARAKLRGPGAWPGRAGVPSRLGAVLTRGLAREREDRWPDMASLLAALHDLAHPRARGRWLGLAATGIGASAIAIVATRPSDPCAAAGDAIDATWSGERREAIAGSLASAIEASDPAAIDRVTAAVDDYAGQWRAAVKDACVAHHVRHEQSDRVLDLRTGCLERRRQGLEAALSRLATDPGVLAIAIDQVYALEPIASCTDIEALAADVAPPGDPALAADVEVLRGRIAQANAKLTAGDFAAALEAIREVQREPAATTYVPVGLEAALVGAEAQSRLGEFAAAAEVYRATLSTAIEIGAGTVATKAATGLASVIGARLQRPIEARIHADLALALARRWDAGGLLELRASGTMANVVGSAGDFPASERLARGVLEMAERTLGAEHLEAARARGLLGHALVSLARFPEAEAVYEAAIATMRTALGPDHPETLFARQGRARALAGQGRFDETEAEQRSILASRERAFGPAHPDTSMARALLAITLREQGRLAESIPAHRAALAAARDALGPDAPLTASLAANLGITLMQAGEFEEAAELFAQSERILTRTLGPNHRDTAGAVFNLGKTMAFRGRFVEAEREYRRTLEIMLTTLPEDHRDIAGVRINLADMLDEQGREAAAAAELRAAIASLQRTFGDDFVEVAAARLNLASVLQDQGELAEAEAEFRLAIPIIEAKAPRRNPNHPMGIAMFGDLLRARGKVDEALPLLERATELIDASDARPAVRGEVYFMLAKALVLRPESRARAIAVARDAQKLLADTTELPDITAQVRAFLAEHDPPTNGR